MDTRKEKNAAWISVPQFGDWDQKGQVPDYSLDFSKIRETRKQNKTNISRASLGNEDEFMNPNTPTATVENTTGHSHIEHQHPHYHQNTSHSPTVPKHHAILVAAHAVDV
ncbi:hypothetical protein PIB30_029647 [Stylosanthes scabra]|uniref:RIN4 pathogenic type III effector avirulence factor Avr cleavage site domain-containing protein n=1 Tax=Stylosanthes scabra TaxID=79078 RepID=A0ABU6SC61_9FABA|nr:hypothetical protein [Stylosanthes scabra]